MGVLGLPFLAAPDLACDPAGSVRVAPMLGSDSRPGVFAAGDCAAIIGLARPEEGVRAVRPGPPPPTTSGVRALSSPAVSWRAGRHGSPGTGSPGTGSPGTGSPGTGSPGTGSPGTGSPGTGSQATRRLRRPGVSAVAADQTTAIRNDHRCGLARIRISNGPANGSRIVFVTVQPEAASFAGVAPGF